VCFRAGDGVQADAVKAAKWFRRSAVQGHAIAQYNLSIVCGRGEGVPKDLEEAFRWCRKSAEQGYVNAQYNLGVMFRDGVGVTQNNSEATLWFHKAAQQGDAEATKLLSQLETTTGTAEQPIIYNCYGPIGFACRSGESEIVALLLRQDLLAHARGPECNLMGAANQDSGTWSTSQPAGPWREIIRGEQLALLKDEVAWILGGMTLGDPSCQTQYIEVLWDRVSSHNPALSMPAVKQKYGDPLSVFQGKSTIGTTRIENGEPCCDIARVVGSVPQSSEAWFLSLSESTGDAMHVGGVPRIAAPTTGYDTWNEKSHLQGAATTALAASPKQPRAPGNGLLPVFTHELSGSNEVRIRNPNPFAVDAGLRSGGGGKDFTVPPSGTESVFVPNGQYDIYFVYSDRPNALFQGDSFSLLNHGIEIQIVAVTDGNYAIRKVR